MRRTILTAASALGFLSVTLVPASAIPSCIDGQRRVDEAHALRHQARQEARLGDHRRVCDTLDEVGDSYREAQDAFEDCDARVLAIGLRSELRTLRIAKRANFCD